MKRARYDVFTLNVGNTHTSLVGWYALKKSFPLAWNTGAEPPGDLEKRLCDRKVEKAPVLLAGVVPAAPRTVLWLKATNL